MVLCSFDQNIGLLLLVLIVLQNEPYCEGFKQNLRTDQDI